MSFQMLVKLSERAVKIGVHVTGMGGLCAFYALGIINVSVLTVFLIFESHSKCGVWVICFLFILGCG